MDGICCAVMEKIKALGTFGRYFVISAEEFKEAFPEGADRSDATLKNALGLLYEGGYIDVRYSGENMYCVAALKEYAPRRTAEDTVRKTAGAKSVSPFWAAFAGGAAGGVLTALLSLLIFLLC